MLKQWGSGDIVGYFLYAIPPPPPPPLPYGGQLLAQGLLKKVFQRSWREFLTTKFKKLSCGSLLSVGSGGGGGGIKKCNVPMKA